MSKTYSKKQQVHSLSILSNAAFGFTFGNDADMQAFVTKVVQQTLAQPETQQLLGNDWATVWGPVVFCNDPKAKKVVADNTLMLLYSPSQNLFVVAIAGTNVKSMFAWFQEDLKTNRATQWEQVTGIALPKAYHKAAIADGANLGLQILLALKDAGGRTLLQALTAYLPQAKPGAEVSVSGHSLGGALTPPMALYLKDTMADWNKGDVVKTISAYPTAGPTCGNEAFALYAGKQLVYESVYNDLDVVPHGWQKDTLAKVPELYGSFIKPPAGNNPFNPIIGSLCVGAVLNTVDTSGRIPSPIAYKQVQPWVPLPGVFSVVADAKVQAKMAMVNLLIPQPLKAYTPYFVNFLRFMTQLSYQHLDAYNRLLHIEKFMEVYDATVAANAPVGQTKEQAVMEAVAQAAAGLTGIDVFEHLSEAEPANA
jgi:hypothetical protein